MRGQGQGHLLMLESMPNAAKTVIGLSRAAMAHGAGLDWVRVAARVGVRVRVRVRGWAAIAHGYGQMHARRVMGG